MGAYDEPELKREMLPRHLQMISVAGAFGTGLIISSGTALLRGGPASLLIAYTIMGINVYFIMTALAEMATYAKMDKGFPGYATRFADPALGFATGYNYFCKYVVVLANNLTAAGIIIQYWRPDLNVGIWITIFAIPVIAINFFHVRVFGETQYIAGVVKLVVMTMLIIACLVASLKPVEGRGVVGFRYWKNPGAFGEYLRHGDPGRFLGFWAAFIQAGFAYIGTEVVGAAFGETPNIKKEVPRAIFWTFWRIVFFYIGGVVVLTMSCPYQNDMLVGATHSKASAAASPFVIAVKLAGFKVLPDVINATLLVFVLSAACSDIYVASRTLYALSKDHQAPRIFKRTVTLRNPTLRDPLSRRDRLLNLCAGVPLASVLFSSSFFLLGYLNVSKSSSTVFGYFVSLVTVFGALNWVSILISYICFCRGLQAQGIRREDLPYRGFLQPYASFFSLGITLLLILFNGKSLLVCCPALEKANLNLDSGFDAFIDDFDVSKLVTSYVGVLIFVVNFYCWKFFAKTTMVKPQDMDLVNNCNLQAGTEHLLLRQTPVSKC
ncbi:dicarboxylic amino acid permease [Diplodia corticola]|uniref:Dicarboxylic amino acid permease n=1 Tax=Diplodia corticola TaxID=236234 RepID=A0A1J9RGP3_9PEZI|nr:dicarboxylic amino acid permease [Diplodia corticola]OJD31707.1 dicarboxylic amino acid permease [Diplodia corticola]